MNRPIQSNYPRTLLWWSFAIAYAVGMILLHKETNQLAGKLQVFLGLFPYLLSVRLLGFIGASAVFFILCRKLSRDAETLRTLLLFVPIALILDLSLISVPIERIHYIQYGLFTWIAYQATGKQFPSMMLAFLVSVIDEANQYWILYSDDRVVYFDWNDLVVNLIGSIAVIFFFLPVYAPAKKLPPKPVVAAILLWIFVVYLSVFLFNPDQYLVRDDPYNGGTSFWITSKINTHYHVMRASEGLIFLGTLLILGIRYYVPTRSPVPVEEPVSVQRAFQLPTISGHASLEKLDGTAGRQRLDGRCVKTNSDRRRG